MCVFVDAFGNIKFAYQTHGIADHVPQDVPYPRKIRPNMRIDVVHGGAIAAGGTATPNAPAAEAGNWGMGTGKFDWNARDDRLETSPLWKSMIGNPANHVVIPVSHGYEMTTRHGDRRWSCIARPDREPWFIPGIGRIQEGKYRTEWHVSMITVDAGPVFSPIHDTPREVAMLRNWQECRQWLAADDWAGLLRPATPDVLESWRVHDDVLKGRFAAEDCPKPRAQQALF